MCRTQCTAFYNLPCFLLFRCTDKIKKFFFMLVLPIVVVVVVMAGCFTGIFSIPCFLRILGCISGIYLVMAIVKCIRKKQEKEEIREKAMEEGREQAKVEAKEEAAQVQVNDEIQQKEGVRQFDGQTVVPFPFLPQGQMQNEPDPWSAKPMVSDSPYL